ncbi:hypothetical protein GPECTOR_187g286 [Gonium pectorale]|uniref:Uncharacterized protein n=1 Tax=Gonium pectorale TaxID=33097 RepID=A0A150FYR1_GONPE|nr:hypothetical protein GPECTOR_187g286 [Gonium pectorale]|eukprot:KXZ42190.1 hypothetical protein GPECTOR_187g286 [Gonium pectorale]
MMGQQGIAHVFKALDEYTRLLGLLDWLALIGEDGSAATSFTGNASYSRSVCWVRMMSRIEHQQRVSFGH